MQFPLFAALFFLLIGAPGGFASGAQAKQAAQKTAQFQQPATVAARSLVDINHASVDELKALTGIGDAWANAIVRSRPYQNKAQLRSRGVIPVAVYQKIQAQIIARQ